MDSMDFKSVVAIRMRGALTSVPMVSTIFTNPPGLLNKEITGPSTVPNQRAPRAVPDVSKRRGESDVF